MASRFARPVISSILVGYTKVGFSPSSAPCTGSVATVRCQGKCKSMHARAPRRMDARSSSHVPRVQTALASSSPSKEAGLSSDEEGGEDGFLELDEGMSDVEEAEDVVATLDLGEDDCAPGITCGGTAWGEAGLQAAKKVLQAPAMDGLDLYLMRAIVPLKKLDIRLDKLTDLYGSPSIDDIEKFSRMMFLEMEALLGTEAAGDISFEVSSPGAERQLQLPGDLARFQKLPLRVEYSDADGQAVTQVLELLAYDELAGTTEWRLADVRANAPMKGRSLSKKQKEKIFSLTTSCLSRVRIHVDF